MTLRRSDQIFAGFLAGVIGVGLVLGIPEVTNWETITPVQVLLVILVAMWVNCFVYEALLRLFAWVRGKRLNRS